MLEFIAFWNREKAHPFRWTFTGYPLQSGIEFEKSFLKMSYENPQALLDEQNLPTNKPSSCVMLFTPLETTNMSASVPREAI